MNPHELERNFCSGNLPRATLTTGCLLQMCAVKPVYYSAHEGVSKFRSIPYSKETVLTQGSIIQPEERRRSEGVTEFLIDKKWSYFKTKMHNCFSLASDKM